MPQLSTMAGAALIRSQEPGTSSSSPTQVQGPEALGHPRLFPRPQAGSWMESGAARTGTGDLMGTRCIQGDEFSH